MSYSPQLHRLDIPWINVNGVMRNRKAIFKCILIPLHAAWLIIAFYPMLTGVTIIRCILMQTRISRHSDPGAWSIWLNSFSCCGWKEITTTYVHTTGTLKRGNKVPGILAAYGEASQRRWAGARWIGKNNCRYFATTEEAVRTVDKPSGII